MPITYACIVNRDGHVVMEGMSSTMPSSMKKYVNDSFSEGKLNEFGQQNIRLSDEYALDYYKVEQVTWVSIRTAKTVDLMEVKMFFDSFMNKSYLNF